MAVVIEDDDFMFLLDTFQMSSEVLTMEEEGKLMVREHKCLQMLREYRAGLDETHPVSVADQTSEGTAANPSP